jgi:hypothetical protein
MGRGPHHAPLDLDRLRSTIQRQQEISQADRAEGRPSDLHSVFEASVLTGISTWTLHRWIRRGTIRCWGHVGCFRVSISDLLPERQPRPTEVPQ